MTYRAIGCMSGSSLDGLDLVFAELTEQAGAWTYEIIAADCYAYSEEWKQKLQGATALSALDYQLLHTAYGHYLGAQINRFIDAHGLHFKVALIASHGHTSFHLPAQKMTAQLGDGAAIAAVTGLPVVSDLRALDLAFGGQGAPIVPIGEKLLLKGFDYYLNLGGIANVSLYQGDSYVAFDICAANRVLNMLAAKEGMEYDAGGAMAAAGTVHESLLQALNGLDYYRQPAPKSLANSFGTDVVFPLIESYHLSTADALRTYVAHLVEQIRQSVVEGRGVKPQTPAGTAAANPQQPAGRKLLATGGGAFNAFVVAQLRAALQPAQIEVVVPDENLVQYKEALIMALIGVLRWRQEYNVLSSVTGAQRDSIGGAVWIGQEA